MYCSKNAQMCGWAFINSRLLLPYTESCHVENFFFLLKDIIHNLEKNKIKFFMHKNNNMKELKKDFYIFYIFIFLNSPPVPGPNCRWGRAGGQSTKISSVWQTFCWGKCARSSTAGWIVCNKKTQIQISRQKSWKIITRQNLLINN